MQRLDARRTSDPFHIVSMHHRKLLGPWAGLVALGLRARGKYGEAGHTLMCPGAGDMTCVREYAKVANVYIFPILFDQEV